MNWSSLILRSKNKFKRINEYGDPTTDFGKPLLQICIDNEKEYQDSKNETFTRLSPRTPRKTPRSARSDILKKNFLYENKW